MFNDFIHFIKDLYKKDRIALHEPVFQGKEIEYVTDCIKSTFVSTVGDFVPLFEKSITDFTRAKYAIATMNGTSALHLAMLGLGVKRDDEVITQNITFIATVNAIAYCNAIPVLIDCDNDNLALSPEKLEQFLNEHAEIRGSECFNKKTGRRLKACIPMHVFGHPAKLDELVAICNIWRIDLLEDAAESLGSFYKGKHTGTFGKAGVFSFNGNKIVTSGGGGMIVTDDVELARALKHLSTTAKVPHKWEFSHDEIGYNYRLPNLNAALGLAQMENLKFFIKSKRQVAKNYNDFAMSHSLRLLEEPKDCISNFWLNAVIFKDRSERDAFLAASNEAGVMTRPLWSLISDLPIHQNAIKNNLDNSEYFRDRLVNLPSGVV